jgi:hypothetical protein
MPFLVIHPHQALITTHTRANGPLQEPRGIYVLDRSCILSDVKTHTSSYDKKKVGGGRVLNA